MSHRSVLSGLTNKQTKTQANNPEKRSIIELKMSGGRKADKIQRRAYKDLQKPQRTTAEKATLR